MTYTKRLKPGAERDHFRIDAYPASEPALGTLAQRLNILIRRHGGSVGHIRLTDYEKKILEECRVSS